jgi:REP element-mobilizing transposase RayT
MERKAVERKAVGIGAIVYALEGTEDHIHVVLAIPPQTKCS